MFEVQCQGCQSPFEVDERRVPRNGMQMRCPKCNTSFLVKRPVGNTAAAEPGAVALPMPKGAASVGLPANKVGPVPTKPLTPAVGPGANAALPALRDAGAGLPVPGGGVGLPAPGGATGLPALSGAGLPARSPGLARGTQSLGVDDPLPIPHDLDLPAIPGTDLPAIPVSNLPPMHESEHPGPNVSPTMDAIFFDQSQLPAKSKAGLPAVPKAGLPAVQGAGLPAKQNAGLPAVQSAGLPALGGVGLPMAPSMGLPAVPATGLPAVQATGLPTVPATGLPTLSGTGLPTARAEVASAAGTPMSLVETVPGRPTRLLGDNPPPIVPQAREKNTFEFEPRMQEEPTEDTHGFHDAEELDLPVVDASEETDDFGAMRSDLPAPTADLPNVAADLPSIEPEPLLPARKPPAAPGAKEGLKLGRIGLERKAFPVNPAEDDLPTVSAGGAALPVRSARSVQRDEREDFRPRRAPLTATPSFSTMPPPAENHAPSWQPSHETFDAPPHASHDPRRSTRATPPPATGGPGFGEIDLEGAFHGAPAPGDFDHGVNGLSEPPDAMPPIANPFAGSLDGSLPPPPPGGFVDLGVSGPPPGPSPADYSLPPSPLENPQSLLGEDLDSLPPQSQPQPRGGAALLASAVSAKTQQDEKNARRFFTLRKKEAAEKKPAKAMDPKRKAAILYGLMGFVAFSIIGGAALALTPYGAFGKNWFDEQINGPDRQAAAMRVIQQVERTMERDTYERALAGLRRLDQALERVPKVQELQAYIIYANHLVVARFGADPARTGRARQVLAQLTAAEAPPNLRFLSLARAAEKFNNNDAREALRLAKNDPAGRDLATMAAERLGDNEQWLRLAQQGRQRHASPRSRYLLARAAEASGDHATARRELEEILRSESQHAGARIMMARFLAQREEDRDRAIELLRDLVRDPSRNARATATASVGERAEACVVAGQIELSRDHVSTAQARFQRALELDPRSAPALVGIGSILFRQGNYADAQARFRNAYSADRRNLDAVVGITQSCLALNQASEAKAAIEPAVREHANDGRLHFWLGKALAATSDQRSLAGQAFREAIRLQPDNLEAYVSLSELLIQMQRPDAADQVLLEARARVPDNAAIHRAMAHGRLARADLAGAESELRIALQREPEDIRSHFALGDVLRRLGRLDDASREFEFVTRVDPNYPGLALARGQLAEARGELPQALNTFREALARDPTNIDLINRVAATLVALGNYGDADQMLRSVVIDQPTNADAQYIMGRAQLGMNNYTDAMRYLDRAIELNPQRADYKAFAAEAHRQAGETQRAFRLAEESIELDPTFPRGYWIRASIRVHQGAADQALADINRATQLDPTFWAAYAAWAEIDDALGHRAEAIELYRRAIQHDNRHGDWYFNYGRLLADAGKEGDARSAFHQARSLGAGLTPTPTWYVQATRALADIERDKHNRAEARRLYTEYLRLVPQGSQAYRSAANILAELAAD